MKISLVAAILLGAISARAACRLSQNDERALASSPSRLTADQFGALGDEEQALVCSTRALLKRVDSSGGQLDAPSKFPPRYLTTEEKQRVNDALTALIERELKNKTGISL